MKIEIIKPLKVVFISVNMIKQFTLGWVFVSDFLECYRFRNSSAGVPKKSIRLGIVTGFEQYNYNVSK